MTDISSTAEDPHSHGRPDEVAVTHLSLDVDVDFERRRLSGSATLDLDRRRPGTGLVLDTWRLEISAVTDGGGRTLAFTVGEHDPMLGSPLTIRIGDADRVVVDYATHPDAEALQWLGPAQTASGASFLFTQSQAIHARSWVPVQDSPAVRFTYDAVVRVPPGLLALMSAENGTAPAPDGVHRFAMRQTVPAYLLALVVGDLRFQSLGERCGVYAEAATLEAAAWEFAETEELISAAEGLFGRYRWERFDILVAPPSFPFGGMENPRLTFVTPTLLAGDRSLVPVIAHELAHSWSGNLVTNATWNDFWLNEGFTTYFETRIVEAVYGVEAAEMQLQNYRDELLAELPLHDERDTWLELDLAGRSPDDGVSPIAYDKGSMFLRVVEAAVGRARFDEFLTAYFDTFGFGTMDTARFLAHLRENLLDPAGVSAEEIQLEAWVHGPGLPDNAPAWAPASFARIDRQLEGLLASGSPDALETGGWRTDQWVHFIHALPLDAGDELLGRVDAALGLSASANSEVLYEWSRRAIETGHLFASRAPREALVAFLNRTGRWKYVVHLNEALARSPEGRALAEEVLAQARAGYHPVTVAAVERILARG